MSMFKFSCKYSELFTFLDETFTRKAQKTLQLRVFAHDRTIQFTGTRTEVQKMARDVFRSKHLPLLQVDAEVPCPFRSKLGRVLESDQAHDSDVTIEDVHATARGGWKIVAIKAYRYITGCSLIEAKNYIENYLDGLKV